MSQADRLAAARTGLAVGPVLRRGLLLATGADARDYLHRVTTQDVNGLGQGGSAHWALLTAKGHLVGEGQLLVQEDGILLDLDPAAVVAVRTALEAFIIADDVALEDRSEAWRVVPLLGPGAASAAARLAPGAARLEHRRRGAPALDLVVPAAGSEALRDAVLAGSATALDEADLEALRIAGGFARWGTDMDGARLPMEAGLTRDAISFTKGCYTGQEVVLRATARGQIQRGLVQLLLPPGAGPGAVLTAAGAEVGRITSAADTPEGRLGLATLRRVHWTAGTRLATEGGEAVVRRAVAAEAEPAATA